MTVHQFKHIILSVLVVCCWMAIALCISAYAFLTTTWGAKIVVNYLFGRAPFSHMSAGRYAGTVERGLWLNKVVLDNLPSIKQGALHLQELYVQIPLIHWNEATVKITNARLMLPFSDPVVFNVTVNKGHIQGNCYAGNVDVHQVISLLGYDDLAKFLHGFISRIDLKIQGEVFAPELTGHFFTDRVIYKETSVSDGFGRLDLTIKSLGRKPLMTGYVIMDSALVETKKVKVDLVTSKVDFNGDATNPFLDIHGSTQVEDINIDMAIKGSLQKPLLLFNSDPPLSEEDILMTLVTGKSWTGVEHDLSQGVGLRKKLNDAFNVGMELEEMPSLPGQAQTPGYARTIEGQMNVTDSISINAAKKFLPALESTPTATTAVPQRQNDAQFYLKYKKRF